MNWLNLAMARARYRVAYYFARVTSNPYWYEARKQALEEVNFLEQWSIKHGTRRL